MAIELKVSTRNTHGAIWHEFTAGQTSIPISRSSSKEVFQMPSGIFLTIDLDYWAHRSNLGEPLAFLDAVSRKFAGQISLSYRHDQTIPEAAKAERIVNVDYHIDLFDPVSFNISRKRWKGNTHACWANELATSERSYVWHHPFAENTSDILWGWGRGLSKYCKGDPVAYSKFDSIEIQRGLPRLQSWKSEEICGVNICFSPNYLDCTVDNVLAQVIMPQEWQEFSEEHPMSEMRLDISELPPIVYIPHTALARENILQRVRKICAQDDVRILRNRKLDIVTYDHISDCAREHFTKRFHEVDLVGGEWKFKNTIPGKKETEDFGPQPR